LTSYTQHGKVTGKTNIDGYMKTTVRSIIPVAGWAVPASECTQRERSLVKVRARRTLPTRNQGLFAYVARETSRTSSYEAVAVAILISCSWVLVFLALGM
jgi:hypothetical protein